ncbi:hypothetical protein BpHYR1_005313, partial [Brachionus plicatilis]
TSGKVKSEHQEPNGVTRLINKVNDNKILIVVPYEETFDEIHTVHLSIENGGVNKMYRRRTPTNLSCEKSLREINSLHYICGGQGVLKCNCLGKCERNSSFWFLLK